MLSPNLLPMFPLFPNKNWKNRDSKTYNRIMFYSDIVELTQVIKQFFADSLEKVFFWGTFQFLAAICIYWRLYYGYHFLKFSHRLILRAPREVR